MEKRSNIVLSLDEGLLVKRDVREDRSSEALAQIIGAPQAYLLRCGVDARGHGEPHFVITAGVGGGADAPCAVTALEGRPLPAFRSRTEEARPVVCGAGPAGLFAALELAEAGMRPILLERGAPVEERRADVAAYRRTRVLNTESNVQFGEGGAGTFSDGKLTCGKNSPLTKQVLETFVAAGAPTEILWDAKPHIGTDLLGDVVRRIRKRIIACGGDVRFHTRVVGMEMHDGVLCGISTERRSVGALRDAGGSACAPGPGTQRIPCAQLILAIGHSARDTLAMLREAGLRMEPKAFSVGVRIEHLQEAIGRAQYGNSFAHPALGAADYKLNVHLKNGRGVYTFCMCPGGEVAAASSEDGLLCVNGMSYHARAGRNANSALLCSVVPEDFASYGAHPGDPLAGIAFQRHWERAAFLAGGGDWRAPVQTVGEFLKHGAFPRAESPGPDGPLGACAAVNPSYPLGVREACLRSCLPAFVGDSLEEALPLLGRKLRGFDAPQAVLTGIEARSSSPVRIVRDRSTLQACGAFGIYPCGEGAGYAGGIMSAAMDGISCARAVIAAAVGGSR